VKQDDTQHTRKWLKFFQQQVCSFSRLHWSIM